MDSEKRTDEFDNDKQTDRLENNEITNEEIIYVDDLDDDYLYINKNNQEEINEKEEKKSKISIDDIINGQKAKKMEKLQQQRQWGIERKVSKLIISLYDETTNSTISGKKIADKCLELWDIMFEKQLGSVREISRKLMER